MARTYDLLRSPTANTADGTVILTGVSEAATMQHTDTPGDGTWRYWARTDDGGIKSAWTGPSEAVRVGPLTLTLGRAVETDVARALSVGQWTANTSFTGITTTLYDDTALAADTWYRYKVAVASGGVATTDYTAWVQAQAPASAGTVSLGRATETDVARAVTVSGGAQWLGLLVTDSELTVWRDRAVNGPYRAAGDYATNSPGDWTRIVGHKDGLAANQNVNYIEPTTQVPNNTATWYQSAWKTQSWRVRDAAFWALVVHTTDSAGATTARNQAKTWLLNQAGKINWKDSAIWPNPNYWATANPMVQLCEWLQSLVHAYDFIRAYERETSTDAFTAAERNTMRDWFYHAADYWQWEQNGYLDNDYGSGRVNTPPTYLSKSSALGGVVWTNADGSTSSDHLWMRHQQNRTIQAGKLEHQVAVLLSQETGWTPPATTPGKSLTQMRNYGFYNFRTTIDMTMTPEGMMGDHERWTSTNPLQGWSYSAAVVGCCLYMAEIEARTGDTAFYDEASRRGQHQTLPQTGDPDKSVDLMMEHFLKFSAAAYDRYGTDSSANRTTDYKIKTWHNLGGADRYHIDDIGAVCVAAGRHTANDLFLRTMRRTPGGSYPGIVGYPANPTDGGQFGWQGRSMDIPGALFMFADTGVNPYPGGA